VKWLLLLVALPASAAPSWATKPDSADSSGHIFTCEGQGATEEDALAAAQGICNDKICKVCGVEVESIVETKETLTGVDFQRKIVERCRRVRKADTKLRAKSVDCNPGAGCSAWIQIQYTKDDEKQECSSYTNEDFTDPAACEADVQAFRILEGHAAAAFEKRREALDKALLHCAKIDVRPTPAILAIDEKLRAGLANFEWTQEMQSHVEDEYQKPRWSFFLPADPKLHSQIAESRLLVDRLRLARDYVANKALVMAAVEATEPPDRDTPAAIARMVKALEAAPRGTQYGVKYDVAFSLAGSLSRYKSDLTPIVDFMRTHYKPEAVDGGDDFTIAKLVADRGPIRQVDWDWQYAAYQHNPCPHCLRTLLQVRAHEGTGSSEEVRVARARQALPSILKGDGDPMWRFGNLIGYSNAELAMELEPFVGAPFTWKFMRELITRFDNKDRPPFAPLMQKAAEVLAADPKVTCTGLPSELELLGKHGGPLAPLDARTCSCLTGELRNEVHLVNRSDLLKHAQRRGLACAKGLPQ
jgi:hypothetical protein